MSLHHIPHKQKITVMLAVMSGLFMSALDQTIVGTALGKIVEDFNNFSALSWIITAYMLTTTITVPISGKLSDMFGRRNLLIIGVTIFTLASFLSGSAPSIEFLIAARALQGIGGGIITSNAFTIIGDLFAMKERAKWQGIIGAVFGLASVAGPLLGGYLTDPHNIFGLTTDWRWTFFINIPIGFVVVILIALTCPNFKHEVRHKIDFLGAGLLAIALSSLILATENIKLIFGSIIDSSGISDVVIKIGLYCAAALFAALFVLAERKAASPILPLHLFKRPAFKIIVPVVLFNGAAFMGAILYLTQFLQQVLGANATRSGLMLMPLIFSLAISSALLGRVLGKVTNFKPLILISLIITGLGILWMTTLNANSSFLDVAMRMIITGIGLGTSFPIFTLMVQAESEQKELGVVTSTVQLARSLGSTIGVAILGGLLTSGVASGLGDISNNQFIQTLKQQPAASQMLGSEIDADTALRLNTITIKEKISAGLESGLNQTALPEIVKSKIKQDFKNQQDNYSTEVKTAFASSLQKVFLVASGFIAIAFVIALFLKKTIIQKTVGDTPTVISE